jgi:hypothetical protein
MRCVPPLTRVHFIALILPLTMTGRAQTPVALPYTMTTIAGGLAPQSSYTRHYGVPRRLIDNDRLNDLRRQLRGCVGHLWRFWPRGRRR